LWVVEVVSFSCASLLSSDFEELPSEDVVAVFVVEGALVVVVEVLSFFDVLGVPLKVLVDGAEDVVEEEVVEVVVGASVVVVAGVSSSDLFSTKASATAIISVTAGTSVVISSASSTSSTVVVISGTASVVEGDGGTAKTTKTRSSFSRSAPFSAEI